MLGAVTVGLTLLLGTGALLAMIAGADFAVRLFPEGSSRFARVFALFSTLLVIGMGAILLMALGAAVTTDVWARMAEGKSGWGQVSLVAHRLRLISPRLGVLVLSWSLVMTLGLISGNVWMFLLMSFAFAFVVDRTKAWWYGQG
jgi:hypothetical protein